MKLFLFLLFCFSLRVSGQVRLPQLIKDSMVLQRDAKIKIWGWASPGEKIKIRFNHEVKETVATGEGKWSSFLSPTKAGGPYSMTIEGKNRIVLHDILMGDVWLCSGQSNMVHQLFLHKERYDEDIAKANYPEIRQFWIPTITNLLGPNEDLPSCYWKAAVPADVLQFSAVAYFFARKIYEKYKVPIGLINSSVGGPPIEAWMSETSLQEFPSVLATVQKNRDTASIFEYNRRVSRKNDSLPKPVDKGSTEKILWFDTSYRPKGWRSIWIPGYWEDQGVKNLDGIVWYRKELDIPASMTMVPAKLFLGRIIDADMVYINGILVGSTSYQYPQRKYQLASGILKQGKNLLVIRVLNYGGKGGFVPDKPYYLAANGQRIDLTGEWKYKVGDVFTPEQTTTPQVSLEYQPTALFNGMIAPLKNYILKGILWYQGEGNISTASMYGKFLKNMIVDWRNYWQQRNLPFLFVQLPAFGDMQYSPSESNLALLRDEQRKALDLPYTGMAVTLDAGEWNDIHPDRKQEVGERLAIGALRIAYNEKTVVPSGPLYQSATVDGDKISISFTNVGSGLITIDDDFPGEFAIAGADKKFLWANARIEENKVIVWNKAIPKPLYVRYAWADTPIKANLYNREKLPASPFRTDHF